MTPTTNGPANAFFSPTPTGISGRRLLHTRRHIYRRHDNRGRNQHRRPVHLYRATPSQSFVKTRSRSPPIRDVCYMLSGVIFSVISCFNLVMAETCSWFSEIFPNILLLRLPYTHSLSNSYTHNTESTAVLILGPERWGSPLVQEKKYQREKACDKRQRNTNVNTNTNTILLL
jgi:hypothetical protein